jgi:hypothetical protein
MLMEKMLIVTNGWEQMANRIRTTANRYTTNPGVSRGFFEANTYLECSCLVLFEREHHAQCSSKRKVQSNNTQTVTSNNLHIYWTCSH